MRFIIIFRKVSKKYTLRTIASPLTLTLLITLISCQKDHHEAYPAALQVFNATDDGISLYTHLSDTRPESFKTSLEIGNKSYIQNSNLLYINNYPQHINFYTKPDTLQHDVPGLSITADLKPGSIFSLFIYGSKGNIESSLIQDKIPAINRNNATTHVRFANFSVSQAISVNIKGQPNGSLFENIPYKSLSAFVTLDANKSIEGYEFEIRNQSTGELLHSYVTTIFQPPLNQGESQWVNKSNTLVFTGKYGAVSPNQQKIIKMNHR